MKTQPISFLSDCVLRHRRESHFPACVRHNGQSTLAVYNHLRSQQPINVFVSLSAFGLGLSTIPFLINFFCSIFRGPKAPRNPWNSTTLEWTLPSPPGHGNFETTPTIYHGPYEYSVPGMEQDFLPQNQPEPETALIAAH
jgi:heme/copper-type cytochrome/quinol oxidase subunit 1